jgi:hypothetical protein
MRVETFPIDSHGCGKLSGPSLYLVAPILRQNVQALEYEEQTWGFISKVNHNGLMWIVFPLEWYPSSKTEETSSSPLTLV